MTVREYAKKIDFDIVGKLKRLPDVIVGVDGLCPVQHCPAWIDEGGNQFIGDYDNPDAYCIIDAEGGVL